MGISRNGCWKWPVVLHSPVPLRAQVLVDVTGGTVLSLAELVTTSFRTYGIAVIARTQARTAIDRDLHFLATNAAILYEVAIILH
jgi:hypothetical protein